MSRLKHWVMNLFASISLLLGLLVTAGWAHGGWHADRFRTVPLTDRWWYLYAGSSNASDQPNVQIAIVHAFPLPLVGRPFPGGPTYIFNRFGFALSESVEFGGDSNGASQYFGRRWDVGMSYGGLIAGLLVLPIVVWVGPVVRRSVKKWKGNCLRVQGKCAICGYDLRATPGCCPECRNTSKLGNSQCLSCAPPHYALSAGNASHKIGRKDDLQSITGSVGGCRISQPSVGVPALQKRNWRAGAGEDL